MVRLTRSKFTFFIFKFRDTISILDFSCIFLISIDFARYHGFRAHVDLSFFLVGPNFYHQIEDFFGNFFLAWRIFSFVAQKVFSRVDCFSRGSNFRLVDKKLSLSFSIDRD